MESKTPSGQESTDQYGGEMEPGAAEMISKRESVSSLGQRSVEALLLPVKESIAKKEWPFCPHCHLGVYSSQ